MKKLLSTLVVLNLSVAPLPVFAEEEALDVGELLLDKAKSAVLGQFQSLLVDAIFGSSGPQYVNLSEESLQQIQNRVREELVRTAEFEYLAEFQSLESSLAHYSDTAAAGNPDVYLLSGLVIKANDVMSHHAFNKNFNDDYYYMADSYALAATVSMSIYTERYLRGSISYSSVASKGDEYANKLEAMVTAKKAADWPLRDRCELSSDPYDQDVEVSCRLTDPHGNSLEHYSFDPRDRYDREEWDQRVIDARASYYQEHIGDLEDAVTELRNF